MSDKYLIVGATGSIGSNLAEQLYSLGKKIHLVGRDEEQTKSLSEKFNCDYTILNVFSSIDEYSILKLLFFNLSACDRMDERNSKILFLWCFS